MQGGKLDTQIVLQRKTKTQDADTGRDLIAWQNVVSGNGRIWAEVQDILPSRDESVRNGIELARGRTRIRFPYRSGLDSSMRVIVHRDGQTTYQIVGGPSVIGRKEGIELLCEKVST